MLGNLVAKKCSNASETTRSFRICCWSCCEISRRVSILCAIHFCSSLHSHISSELMDILDCKTLFGLESIAPKAVRPAARSQGSFGLTTWSNMRLQAPSEQCNKGSVQDLLQRQVIKFRSECPAICTLHPLNYLWKGPILLRRRVPCCHGLAHQVPPSN